MDPVRMDPVRTDPAVFGVAAGAGVTATRVIAETAAGGKFSLAAVLCSGCSWSCSWWPVDSF
jgi:hypothetical protein